MLPLRSVPIIVVAASLFACGGGDSQGPKLADVAGAWRATWTNMSGGGHSCGLTLAMTLTHQGTAFTGSYSNAIVACDGQSSAPFTGTVVNGAVNGDQLSFDLDTTALPTGLGGATEPVRPTDLGYVLEGLAAAVDVVSQADRERRISGPRGSRAEINTHVAKAHCEFMREAINPWRVLLLRDGN